MFASFINNIDVGNDWMYLWFEKRLTRICPSENWLIYYFLTHDSLVACVLLWLQKKSLQKYIMSMQFCLCGLMLGVCFRRKSDLSCNYIFTLMAQIKIFLLYNQKKNSKGKQDLIIYLLPFEICELTKLLFILYQMKSSFLKLPLCK